MTRFETFLIFLEFFGFFFEFSKISFEIEFKSDEKYFLKIFDFRTKKKLLNIFLYEVVRRTKWQDRKIHTAEDMPFRAHPTR